MTLLAATLTMTIKAVSASIATIDQADEMTMTTAVVKTKLLDEARPLRPGVTPHATTPIDAEIIAAREIIVTRETIETRVIRVTREIIVATIPHPLKAEETTTTDEMDVTEMITIGETITIDETTDVAMETKNEEETTLPPGMTTTDTNPINTVTTEMYMIIDAKFANTKPPKRTSTTFLSFFSKVGSHRFWVIT